MTSLYRISNTTSGHCLGDYEAENAQHALDVMSLGADRQTHAEYIAAQQAMLDADGWGNKYKDDLIVREVDDSDYGNLFLDYDCIESNRLYGFRLERFVRAWYHTATGADEYTLEALVAHGGKGDDAIDYLFNLLSQARDEVDAFEPTLLQCCEELASWGKNYEDGFGCRVIAWKNGRRTVHWGSGDEFVWTELESVLRAVPEDDETPEWWDSDWDDYEDFDYSRGKIFVKANMLSKYDPRHPDYTEPDEDEIPY